MTKQSFEESLLSGFDVGIWAKLFFDLVEIFWHDDLSLFAEHGQNVVKEIVWG